MSTVKLYQVAMDSDIQSKTFQLGGGKSLTLANGTILDEGHEIVKKFPSYCILVGEKVVEGGPELLAEAPIAPAEPEVPEVPVVPEAPVDAKPEAIVPEQDAEPEVIAPEPEAPVVPEVKPEAKPAAKADTKPAAPAKK